MGEFIITPFMLHGIPVSTFLFNVPLIEKTSDTCSGNIIVKTKTHVYYYAIHAGLNP